MPSLRDLPAVDKLIQHPILVALAEEVGRDLTVDAARAALSRVREQFSKTQTIPTDEQLASHAQTRARAWASASLVPVINASGTIIHTNLGRAPLSPEALRAMSEVAHGYSNLEYDLPSGKRGSRTTHAEDLLKRITGAEAALVVNNNASAVLLALGALANRRRVIIPRTQMIEIGGGFRIPDVMRQSGAKLVEIGTTNRVHLYDYENALAEQPIKLVMAAHQSNFRITGFTTEPDRAEIAAVCAQYEVPFMEDLGSGTFLDTAAYGLTHEPTVQELVTSGIDLVTFSGDKLLGGPQAGIIVGRADLLKKLKKHPLTRAIRVDKLIYAALSATLLHYVKGEAERKVPVWRMISAAPDVLRRRADVWQTALGAGEVIEGQSTVGGGSLPGELLPTWLLALSPRSTNRFLKQLRSHTPPIIARAQDDRVVFDPRTVLPEQEEIFLAGLNDVLKNQV